MYNNKVCFLFYSHNAASHWKVSNSVINHGLKFLLRLIFVKLKGKYTLNKFEMDDFVLTSFIRIQISVSHFHFISI